MGKSRREKCLRRQRRKKRQERKVKNGIRVKNIVDIEELHAWREKRIKDTDFKDGHNLEEIVQKICTRIGTPDLVIRSPKYIDSGGIQKEICDLLILFDDTAIVFQVKHRTIDRDADLETILQRAHKTIEKAKNQFATFISLYEQEKLPRMRTIRGFEVEVRREKFTNLHLVAVVSYPGSDEFPEDKKFNVVNGYTDNFGFPVHVFDINDYDKISLELDTIVDFLRYLLTRKKFFSQANIGETQELDLLGYYKTKVEDLAEALEQDAKIVFHEGIWDTYVNHFGSQIVGRNKKNEISYLYDLFIDKSHLSIGFEKQLAPVVPTINPGTEEAHFYMATELSKYPRISRRGIGEALRECLIRADRNLEKQRLGYAYRLVQFKEMPGLGLVILACASTSIERSQRVNFLNNLCQSAYFKFRLSKVIGIATESANCTNRSEDFFCFHELIFDEQEKEIVTQMADKLWAGPLFGSKDSEY